MLASHIRHFGGGISIMNVGVRQMSIQTMESMVKWVDNHVKENPTLENMSSHVGYSSYYCSTKFHEYTGITYKQYVARRKLNTAAELLLISKARIVDIALECGYLSPEAFSRAFVVAYKCTPTQYRKTHQ